MDPKTKPLPADYVRPTLAEYLAASKAHTKDTYLPFVNGHEAELRKHYVAPELEAVDPPESDPVLELEPEAAPEPEHYFNPREAMAASAELSDLDEALTEPFNPRAALQKQAAPEAYVRPSVAEWQAAGYGKDLAGDALSEAHKKFFEAYEAELQAKPAAADPASGELSPSA